MQNWEIIVIGGGPAGLMAALTAAAMGRKVIILEKMDKPGRKLLVTGRGRCNLSNQYMDPSHYHSGKKNFVRDVLSQFGLQDTLDFFRELGVPTRVEKEGKIIPWTQQASSVLEALLLELQDLGVEIRTGFRVADITYSAGSYTVRDGTGHTLTAPGVVLASGGRSYPELGSAGDGYPLAERLGHRVATPFPALVHIRSGEPYLKKIAGNSFDGTAFLETDGRVICSYSGEILFTDYGISGIPLLQLSRHLAVALQAGQSVRILLDYFPETEEPALQELLLSRAARHPERTVSSLLNGVLHSRLIPVVLQENRIEPRSRSGSIPSRTWSALAAWLKSWPLSPTGTRGWEVAQVTAGGVDAREVDPLTLQSRVSPGFFLAGEVLDVDGECGGYNLQWAWSSGFCAGRHAAEYLESLP